jgi:hypothetical protein
MADAKNQMKAADLQKLTKGFEQNSMRVQSNG